MVDGEGEAADTLPWIFRTITRRVSELFGKWFGDRFADLLIFSIAGGLLAWSYSMIKESFGGLFSAAFGVIADDRVLPYVMVIILMVVTILVIFVPLVLFVDTLKRRFVVRSAERDLDRILERQDLTDDLRAEIEEAQRNVRTGQPVLYLRPYKQMWQWLRSKFRRKQGE